MYTQLCDDGRLCLFEDEKQQWENFITVFDDLMHWSIQYRYFKIKKFAIIDTGINSFAFPQKKLAIQLIILSIFV